MPFNEAGVGDYVDPRLALNDYADDGSGTVLPMLATVAELEVRVGRPFSPVEVAQAREVLRDVSALVRDEVGASFVNDYNALALPDSVRAVVLIVARRAFMNPRQVTSNQIGGYSERVHDDQASGIFLTKLERRQLHNSVGRAVGAGTIRVPQAYTPLDDTLWAYTSQGFDPVPMEVL